MGYDAVMKRLFPFCWLLLAGVFAGCQSQPGGVEFTAEPATVPVEVTNSAPPSPPTPPPAPAPEPAKTNAAPAWLGVQLFIQTDADVKALATAMPRLSAMGVNAIIVETGYSFDFKSHPELRRGKGVSRAAAKNLAAVARTNGVRLIPELDCLGHQSVRTGTLPLLARYPEFAEPPPSNPDPTTSYLKNWCPNDPRINPIVFDLIDEIAEAFDANAFHVGMDEVFNLASDNCPRCRGKDRAKLFAKTVNELYAHIVGQKKLEMFMWGDRLLDAGQTGYYKWDASRIGTAGAINLISTNIVICDWHYSQLTNYPSVPLFLKKGFRVWPAGFQPLAATRAFSDYARKLRATNPRVVGYLCTTWSTGKPATVAEWPPVKEILKDWVAATNSAVLAK
jgi:hypothetical protein